MVPRDVKKGAPGVSGDPKCVVWSKKTTQTLAKYTKTKRFRGLPTHLRPTELGTQLNFQFISTQLGCLAELASTASAKFADPRSEVGKRHAS